jgi:hypothetical protein
MRKINLSIPEPCHEDWNKMTPCEKGKFCAACQKAVIDFTQMSDRQIAEHFKKPQGSVCGRFMGDQLNRDMDIPRKRIPWIKYFFQFSLPAFLVSLKAGAQQGKVRIQGDTVIVATAGLVSPKVVDQKRPVQKQIAGTIHDKDGRPITNASVARKGKNKSVATDRRGKFSIRAIEGDRLVVSAPGFKPKEIAAISETQILLKEEQCVRAYAGGISVRYTVIKSNPLQLIKKLIDTSTAKFSFYPNPLRAGGNYSIDTKKLQSGDYVMNVVDNSGAIVHTEDVSIITKQVLSGNLPAVAAGNYYIRLTNKKSGASYSNKIVVQ